MTDHNFTDEEAVEGLSAYVHYKCENCTVKDLGICCNSCFIACVAQVGDLANRQKAEIERLTMKLTSRTDENTILRRYFGIKTDEQVSRIIANYKGVIQTTKSEAIKEFAERLKSHLIIYTYINLNDAIDTLVKEMTEGQK